MAAQTRSAPDAFVFEGGGALGVAYVGVVRVLQEVGALESVHKFAGSSIGAFAAALLACGARAQYIETAFAAADMPQLKDASRFIVPNVWRLLERGGWALGAALEQLFAKHLEALTGNADITFAQVRDTFGNTLIITGTSLTYARTEYFSHASHPHMPVKMALKISTAVPALYPFVQFDAQQWWDGGILDNYPIHVFDQSCEIPLADAASEPSPALADNGNGAGYGSNSSSSSGGNAGTLLLPCAVRAPEKRVISAQTVGFKLVTSGEQAELLTRAPTRVANGIDAGLAVLKMLIDRGQRLHEHRCDWARTVVIPVGQASATDFNMSGAEQQALIDAAVDATRAFWALRLCAHAQPNGQDLNQSL